MQLKRSTIPTDLPWASEELLQDCITDQLNSLLRIIDKKRTQGDINSLNRVYMVLWCINRLFRRLPLTVLK